MLENYGHVVLGNYGHFHVEFLIELNISFQPQRNMEDVRRLGVILIVFHLKIIKVEENRKELVRDCSAGCSAGS